LGCLDHAKAVLPSRHRQIDSVIARDLEEHPRVWATLVGLPRRVQEPRPELEACGDRLISRIRTRIRCNTCSYASFISR
jgi:hypothetical protein